MEGAMKMGILHKIFPFFLGMVPLGKIPIMEHLTKTSKKSLILINLYI